MIGKIMYKKKGLLYDNQNYCKGGGGGGGSEGEDVKKIFWCLK